MTIREYHWFDNAGAVCGNKKASYSARLQDFVTCKRCKIILKRHRMEIREKVAPPPGSCPCGSGLPQTIPGVCAACLDPNRVKR